MAQGTRPPGQTLLRTLEHSEMISKGAWEPRGGHLAPAHLPLKQEREISSSSVGIYFTELAIYMHQDVCANIFMSALFITAPCGEKKNPKCQSTGSI